MLAFADGTLTGMHQYYCCRTARPLLLLLLLTYLHLAVAEKTGNGDGTPKPNWNSLNVGKAKIDSLLQTQKGCFKKALPCVLLADDKRSIGCSQCGFSSKTAAIKEYRSPEVLYNDLTEKQSEKMVIMISEALVFKDMRILQSIEKQPENVLAVIVVQVQSPMRVNNSDIESNYPPVSQFSGDKKLPNEEYSFRANADYHPKNIFGTGIQHLKLPVNIFYVTAKEAADIRTGMSRNIEYGKIRASLSPKLKAQSNGKMDACHISKNLTPKSTSTSMDTNSKQCLQNESCLPVGGYSVWSALGQISQIDFNQTREVVAVTAPMDSTAIFHELALGASAEIASLASLMAVIKSVGEYSRASNYTMKRQPMYFGFNAQSWGFTGSGRFLEDVKNFECIEVDTETGSCKNPYAPSLKFLALRRSKFKVINLGGMVSQTPKFFTEPNFGFFKHGFSAGNVNGTGGIVEEALNTHFTVSDELKLDDGFRNSSYMDASQSFHQYYPDSDVVTLTNFKFNFSNLFYHSPYDNPSLFDKNTRRPLYTASSAVARAVIQLSFGDENAKVEEEPNLIDEIINCMTTDWMEKNCSLAMDYLEDDYDDIFQYVTSSNYAGVYAPLSLAKSLNPSGYGKAIFLQRFMAYHNRFSLTEDKSTLNLTCSTKKHCEDVFQNPVNENITSAENFKYAYCIKGYCLFSESHLHAAFGTGLISINSTSVGYKVIGNSMSDKNLISEQPLKPTWTESNWGNDLGICFVIEDSTIFGGLVLACGLSIFAFSLLVSWLINRLFGRSDIMITPDEYFLDDDFLYDDLAKLDDFDDYVKMT